MKIVSAESGLVLVVQHKLFETFSPSAEQPYRRPNALGMRVEVRFDPYSINERLDSETARFHSGDAMNIATESVERVVCVQAYILDMNRSNSNVTIIRKNV